MDDPDNNTIDRYGIANLFELLSGLYFRSGNCAFATTCLLQSIIETPSRITDTVMYDNCNFGLHSSFYHDRPIQEASFTLLYLGLAHEIGHTYADDCLRIGANVHPQEITDEAIKQAVVESAKSAFNEIDPSTDYFFKRWHESYLVASKDERSILHCGNLRSEILADFLGFNILITSMKSLTCLGHQQLSFKIVVSETIVGLFVVQLLEACKYLVAALPDKQSNPELVSRYFPISVGDAPLHAHLNVHEVILDFQIAHAVRWQFLKPSFISLALMHLFPDTFSVRHGEAVVICSQPELTRRREIAASNVEGYLGFYTKEMKKLQARLEDVVNFVSHVATGEIPSHRVGGATDAKKFGDYIAGNFERHLDRLNGRAGAERKREILAQLKEYSGLLRGRSKEEGQHIEGIIRRLESNLDNYQE